MLSQEVTEEITRVVWWALPLGGLVGGIARCFLDLKIELPFYHRYDTTNQIVLVPGFIGNLVLGPIAAVVVAGLATATVYNFQTDFDEKGFFGPFAASIVAGIAAVSYLEGRAKQVVNEAEQEVLSRAEEEADAPPGGAV